MAILYANRLLNNGVTGGNINLLDEGPNRAVVTGVNDLNFVVENAQTILHYVNPERVHLLPPGDDDNEDDDDVLQTGQVINYYVGFGVLGDFMAAYFIPRVGPWFPHSASSRVTTFIKAYTKAVPLNSAETIVVQSLACNLGLALVNTVLTEQASILTQNFIFTTTDSTGATIRQLFNNNPNVFQTVTTKTGEPYTLVTCLDITAPTGTCGTSTVSISAAGGDVTFDSQKVRWKTNPYTYLRLATSSGWDTKASVNIPTFYRSVLSVPNNNTTTGVNLPVGDSSVTGADYVSSYVAFSLYALNSPVTTSGFCTDVGNLPITWLVQAYTTVEDLSVVGQQGSYAPDGSSLLIIEAINVNNLRSASYSVANQEIQVFKNSNTVEANFMQQFANIVSSVYFAYTGVILDTATLMGTPSVCGTTAGVTTCVDGTYLVDYATRESPMNIVLETMTCLYGSTIYPTVCKC
jgi:hypothetical protein